MALKPQSIRKNQTILVEGVELSKDELILISESWNENQEIFFRKMLKQGGEFKLKGIKYTIILDSKILRSDGSIDKGVTQIPGDDVRF